MKLTFNVHSMTDSGDKVNVVLNSNTPDQTTTNIYGHKFIESYVDKGRSPRILSGQEVQRDSEQKPQPKCFEKGRWSGSLLSNTTRLPTLAEQQ